MNTTTTKIAGEDMTKDQIRDIFMAHGFTIKEGQTDLKPYVYDAARALLASKPAVPEGWKLVPEKVTNAMIDAANDTPSGIAGTPPHWQWVWDAMLAASPTAPAQPCGEDAANGAIGEREAFDQWFKTRGVWPRLTYLEIWQASRAALTAEKVAGQEPVGEVTATALEGADRGVIGWYGDPLPVNSLLYAAPPQPAQSTEPTDDEIEAMCAEHGLGPNVGKLVVKDALNRWRTAQSAEQDEPALTIENNNPATQKIIERWLQDDPQPAQTQVVLTKEMIGAAWRDCGARSVSPPEWALQFAQSIARALLAAQPVSGGNSADQA
jgi:hypothetical protein